MPTPIDRLVATALVALALSAAGGCGGAAPAAADADRARETLTRALDAWKGGESAESLFRSSPSIHVADEEWRGGAALESYEIQGPGESVGHRWTCKALLTVKDAAGKPRRRLATYAVSTAPTPSVVRLED